jgi:LEA14-like dessication related protein
MNKIISCLIILLVISCAAVKERLAIKECKFSLLSVTPHDFTFNNFKLDFKIKTENPNKIDAVLNKLTYTFYANNTDIFSGTTGKGIKIPAGKSNSFTTTMLLDYTKIGAALVEAIKLKKASYKIKAKAYINTIIGEISYPVEITL